MNNPYALMNDSDIAMMLIALAGYPDEDLCRQGAVIEAELRSRHQGHYPAWFTPAQIAVCQTLHRYVDHNDKRPLRYLSINRCAMKRAGEWIPAFFDESRPLIDILRQLARSGLCLRWNAPLRTLEIIPQDALPTLSCSTPVYPQP